MNKNDGCNHAVNNLCVQEFNTCITGGGLAALFLGIKLLEKDKQPSSVCVLDPSIVSCSPSAKHSGFGPNINYSDLARNYERIGARRTQSSVRSKFSGFAQLLRLIGSNPELCQPCGTIEVLSDSEKDLLAHLEEINNLMSPLFGDDVFEVRKENVKLAQIGLKTNETLIFSKLGWQLNPGKIIIFLMKRFQELGGIYLTGCQLVLIEQTHPVESPRPQSDYLGYFDCSRVKLTVQSCCSGQRSFIKCQSVIHCARTDSRNCSVLLTEPLPELSLRTNWYFSKYSIRARPVGSQLLFELPNKDQELDAVEARYVVDRCQSLMPNIPIRSALCWRSGSNDNPGSRIQGAIESIKILGKSKLHSWIISDSDMGLGGEVQVALKALNLMLSKDPKL